MVWWRYRVMEGRYGLKVRDFGFYRVVLFAGFLLRLGLGINVVCSNTGVIFRVRIVIGTIGI